MLIPKKIFIRICFYVVTQTLRRTSDRPDFLSTIFRSWVYRRPRFTSSRTSGPFSPTRNKLSFTLGPFQNSEVNTCRDTSTFNFVPLSLVIPILNRERSSLKDLVESFESLSLLDHDSTPTTPSVVLGREVDSDEVTTRPKRRLMNECPWDEHSDSQTLSPLPLTPLRSLLPKGFSTAETVMKRFRVYV